MEKGDEESKIVDDTLNETERNIIEKLTPEMAADIVLASMVLISITTFLRFRRTE
jgi:hypothetical protein